MWTTMICIWCRVWYQQCWIFRACFQRNGKDCDKWQWQFCVGMHKSGDYFENLLKPINTDFMTTLSNCSIYLIPWKHDKLYYYYLISKKSCWSTLRLTKYCPVTPSPTFLCLSNTQSASNVAARDCKVATDASHSSCFKPLSLPSKNSKHCDQNQEIHKYREYYITCHAFRKWSTFTNTNIKDGFSSSIFQSLFQSLLQKIKLLLIWTYQCCLQEPTSIHKHNTAKLAHNRVPWSTNIFPPNTGTF